MWKKWSLYDHWIVAKNDTYAYAQARDRCIANYIRKVS